MLVTGIWGTGGRGMARDVRYGGARYGEGCEVRGGAVWRGMWGTRGRGIGSACPSSNFFEERSRTNKRIFCLISNFFAEKWKNRVIFKLSARLAYTVVHILWNNRRGEEWREEREVRRRAEESRGEKEKGRRKRKMMTTDVCRMLEGDEASRQEWSSSHMLSAPF